jgi:Peptidase family S41/N-terminal domain of Peptidase_S41 in eukaryotic IRBP
MLIDSSWRRRLDSVPRITLAVGEAAVKIRLVAASAIGFAALCVPGLGQKLSEGELSPAGFPQAQQQNLEDAVSALVPAVAEDVKLEAAERQRVIDAVITNLQQHYINPAVAHKMAEALLAAERAGDYAAITDGAAFALLLTRQLRDVSHDMHLEVVYSQNPLPERSTGPTPERLARYRKAMEENNCTFEKAQILPHNIGYLKLDSFPDPSVCETTAKAAMASLNDAAAIIFDLRDNRGGYPSMVMLIAAYLFDHPEYMYNPRENTTEQSWTRSPVPKNRLADTPVYVLTSARTFSGAEQFGYDLKMLRRATLVGETTGGATDVGIFHRVDDHFGMGIRETRAINPYSEADWAVTGVKPDVKAKAADALEVAGRLAQSTLRKK